MHDKCIHLSGRCRLYSRPKRIIVYGLYAVCGGLLSFKVNGDRGFRASRLIKDLIVCLVRVISDDKRDKLIWCIATGYFLFEIIRLVYCHGNVADERVENTLVETGLSFHYRPPSCTHFCTLLLFITAIINFALLGMEQHCRDPADCPLFPVHSCFATERGLVCRNQSKEALYVVSFLKVKFIWQCRPWRV
ncbi:hypothetical protein BJV82DRAFT_598510 [Fennellomyces sp. T-0311]|nr:hypothetical protein BJV82DRAFT_598510 [Fennellomyces sp. T-0311]